MDSARYLQIKAMVEKIYELTGTGQWDAVGEMLTDDFSILEAESLPYAGEYKGKDALQKLYTVVFNYWEDASLHTDDICISENNAVVLLSIHATSRHSGERLEMPLAEVLHVRGDKFCGIKPYYFDTAAIAKATGIL